MSTFIVVPFILAVVVQAWFQTISVDTTSGHLSGTQADGGTHSRYRDILLSELTRCTSGILQRHCKSL